MICTDLTNLTAIIWVTADINSNASFKLIIQTHESTCGYLP